MDIMKKTILLLGVIFLLLLILGIATFFFWNHTSTPTENTLPSENVSQQENILFVQNTTENTNVIPEPPVSVYTGMFELPLNGSTGFASVALPLYENIPTDGSAKKLATVSAGKAFCIQEENGEYFRITLVDETAGWIESKYCLINLPDILPSIVYDDTNSYSSVFRSSGYALDGITGKRLYNVKKENTRLEKEEFLMPVLYPMAKKIAQVQKDALANEDTLKIYETYRQYEVQMKVSDSLTKLMDANEIVAAGINTKPWGKSWFIATQLSNHQRGIAMDVSLAKIKQTEIRQSGNYSYKVVTEHEEYKMPSQMHELSKAAATFTSPVSSKSKTDWKKAKLAPKMTDGAKKLQQYCTEHELYPLASEWWHFNDLDAREDTKAHGSNGKYYLKDCLSTAPAKEETNSKQQAIQ